MVKEFEDIRVLNYDKNKYKIYQPTNVGVLKTLNFNKDTLWVDDTIPNKILEDCKVPPFVEELHKQGLTGKGINVAIIDQPLALNHPEYKDKIKEYKVFAPKNYDMEVSSMHGPAVTSLLVGETIGTAPDAKVYYAANPSWLGDALYEVNALNWIMEVNKKLKDKDKIKFVSVSAAPGEKSIRQNNYDLWLKTVKKAEEEGLCVVECTEGNRFVTVGYIDYETKKFCYGFPNMRMKTKQENQVHVPNSCRTVAESYDNINFSYTYNGVGGLSWGIPYAVGILCLGQQANPNLSAFELKKILIETAQNNNCIINPLDFINTVKEQNLKLET